MREVIVQWRHTQETDDPISKKANETQQNPACQTPLPPPASAAPFLARDPTTVRRDPAEVTGLRWWKLLCACYKADHFICFFTYNHAYPTDSTHRYVSETSIKKKVVQNLFNSYNVIVLTHSQTGCDKAYTTGPSYSTEQMPQMVLPLFPESCRLYLTVANQMNSVYIHDSSTVYWALQNVYFSI